MLQQEIPALLAPYKTADVYTKFRTELKEVYDNQPAGNGNGLMGKIRSVFGQKQNQSLLNGYNAELGLLLLNALPGYEERSYNHVEFEEVTYKNKRYNRIVEILGDTPWENPHHYQLLVYFLGDEKAACALDAWNDIPQQMYQTGYSRRSFRSPRNREMYLANQVNFIIRLLPQAYSSNYTRNGYVNTYYDLSITEQVRYNHLYGDSNQSLFRLWSAAINKGNAAVFKLMEDIVFNRDESGKVTRNIIKALLNSNWEEAWVLVEKLLLAAQRQEGLRQSILEALDETSIGALRHMIGVIIEHQLTRFSSVVRAVNVWAGLGWETERESTIRNFLEKAQQYLDDPSLIPNAIISDNNADVYMALWAKGVYDVEETIPFLQQLLASNQQQKRTLALMFANQTAHYKINMPSFYASLSDQDLEPLALAVNYISFQLYYGGNNKFYDGVYPDLFDQLENVYKRVSVKEKVFDNYVFSWVKIQFEKKTILQCMIRLVLENQDRLDKVLGYYDEMDAATRHQLSSLVLPVHSQYNYQLNGKPGETLTSFQRNYALLILKDRSEFETAYKALYHTNLTREELEIFPELLKRKAAGFRSKIIDIMVRQDDNLLIPVVKQILLTGDPEQRLAGLDLLLQLKNSGRLPAESKQWVAEFSNRKSISAKEEILLSQLTGINGSQVASPENGYGIFDPAKQSAIITPTIDPFCLYEELNRKNKYGFTLTVAEIKSILSELHNLYLQHKDHEYEVENWDNSKEKVLLGNVFRIARVNATFTSPDDEFKNYPLHEVWENWFRQTKLQPIDLFIILLYANQDLETIPEAARKYIPQTAEFLPVVNAQGWYQRNPVLVICEALYLLHPYKAADEFCIGGCKRLFASLDKATLNSKDEKPYYRTNHRGWQEMEGLKFFLGRINIETLDARLVEECWNLYHWRQYNGLKEYENASISPLMIFCRAFEEGIIGEDEMIRGMLTKDNIRALSQKTHHKNDIDYRKRFPFLDAMFRKISDHILDIELKRGDSSTAVTGFAASLQSINGVNRLTELLAGLGKTTLYRGYIYFGSDLSNKQETFSTLIKRCQPGATDSQADFDASMKKIKATEQRLIEIAVYAPQWQAYISQHLGWKGLDSAIWWMHAHTKTDAYRAQNAETESEIARYSTLDVQEFTEGAVDKEWFLKAYKEIGKERWSTLYDAAKYISDGNGHRRARIYADVLLGNLNPAEVFDKIKTKRDQDYLRVFGLAPLRKANPGKDILERYEFIEAFRKESRQFGAQKQTSEGVAIRIALENLARNAGYPDPIRFTWAMETRQVQSIFSKETQVQYDDVLIGLVIDDDGNADVVAFKDEKQLKAIPAKYKKDKKVEELQGFKKTLREQYCRSSRGLEDAMVRGDLFKLEEIRNLYAHPVISKHLEKLVFVKDVNEGQLQHGFYKDQELLSANGTVFELAEKDHLRIAHCTDLFNTGCWADYQAWAFDKKLQQPFRQIFRELYIPTTDELAEKSVSRRYAGHQVQPRQTVALLKTRGWKVNYEEGLQKVYHKEGFAVRMYAMADWFSPAEVENPTLETVRFESLKNGVPVPFSEIHPRIFSEVMRDIDLVVSVAHAGGVDAEASHSSVEMRTVLLRETMRLFKITNVEIKGSHALIKGTMGEYNVHLGSAVVHKMAAGYISILPVHAQQRGRIFLPFVDDDPKSAEVISKVLLLSRDSEIQDPTILAQLR